MGLCVGWGGVGGVGGGKYPRSDGPVGITKGFLLKIPVRFLIQDYVQDLISISCVLFNPTVSSYA